MRLFIVDTNALLRFLLNDIPKQKRAVERLLQQTKRKQVGLIVPQIVIFEIEFALRKYYKFPKEKTVDKLSSLVETDYIAVESKQTFITALKIYKGINISFVDCFLLAQAADRNIEIFSFDKKLISLDRKQGKR